MRQLFTALAFIAGATLVSTAAVAREANHKVATTQSATPARTLTGPSAIVQQPSTTRNASPYINLRPDLSEQLRIRGREVGPSDRIIFWQQRF